MIVMYEHRYNVNKKFPLTLGEFSSSMYRHMTTSRSFVQSLTLRDNTTEFSPKTSGLDLLKDIYFIIQSSDG